MVDSAPPYDVITLLFQKNAAAGEFNAETAADENQERCAFLALHPLQSLVATRVDTPFDLYGLAVARIANVLEVPEEPPRSSAASLPALPTYTLSFTRQDASSRSCGGNPRLMRAGQALVCRHARRHA
ncbi:hypothetical protein GCM10017744_090670 [Streptomyces antimycoticus]